MPVLTEIKIDDQFKEIYEDYFIYERDEGKWRKLFL